MPARGGECERPEDAGCRSADLALTRGDDGKGTGGRGTVRDEVVEERLTPEVVVRGDRDQHVEAVPAREEADATHALNVLQAVARRLLPE